MSISDTASLVTDYIAPDNSIAAAGGRAFTFWSAAMPANNEPDILGKLQRLLAVTPEHTLATPPVSRATIVAAVLEIACLRTRVAELEATGNELAADLVGIIAATNGKPVQP